MFRTYLKTLPEHTSVQEQDGQEHLDHQPTDNVDRLRSLEQPFAVLDAQNRFGHHYRSVHPALGADAFAARVRNVHVVLAYRWRHKQSDEHQPNGDQRMRRRHLENVLQEERVQFGDLPEDDQLADAPEPHVRGLGIQPADARPTARSELENGTLDLAAGR